MPLKAPRPDLPQLVKENLQSKTFWFNVASSAGMVTAYLVANPATLAAYGPHAAAAVGIANVLLYNWTNRQRPKKP
jgi:hypothetical protein